MPVQQLLPFPKRVPKLLKASTVLLGDVCAIDARKVDPKLPEFRDLPHVYGASIQRGTGRLLTVNTAAEDKMISDKYLFEDTHVIYSKIRPYLRKVAYPRFRGLCSADAYPLAVDTSRLDPGWLVWRLLSDEFTAYVIKQSKGRARIPKVNQDELFSWQFTLPSLDEQQDASSRLEKKLEVLARLNESAARASEAASLLQPAILREAFHQQWPLTFGQRGKQTLPSDWRWVTLTDVARLESGHTPSRYKPSYWGGHVPWVSLRDVATLNDFYINDTSEHPTQLGIENSAARILPAGTVILSRTASIGRCVIMGRDMATSQDFANWVCGPELDPLFLLFVFRGSLPVLQRASEGATHKTIYMPTIKRAQIILPPLSEQRRIVKQLSIAWERARSLETEVHQSTRAVQGAASAFINASFRLTGEE
jgi:type I restriction enzyme S subunit